MAIREILKRRAPLINLMRSRRAKIIGKQIFIAHSSRDKYIIKLIEDNLENIGVRPFLAGRFMAGKPAIFKIIDGIWDSIAFFILWTKNVTDNPETRDWVSFEIGIAKALADVGLLSIYGWYANDTKLTDLLKGITDMVQFNPYDKSECEWVVKTMIKIAQTL